jgi:DME family drug/metabolite transporter
VSSSRNVPITAYLQILAGAVLLSTGSSVIKAVSFNALELAGWRALIIALFLAAVIRPPRACWDRALIPAALAHGITTLLFMWGNKLTTAAIAIFLQYTAPLYLLLLGPWLLKEPVRKSDVFFVVLIAGGMVLLLLKPAVASNTASNPGLGAIIAGVCGVAWAFTTLTMRDLSRRVPDGFQRAIAAVILANVVLAALLLPLVGVPDEASPGDWALVSYMGIFQLGCAFILVSLGLRRVTALEGALLLLLEPLLNPVWAFFAHDEMPGGFVLVGGAVILLASAARVVVNTRRGGAQSRS